MTEQSVAHGWHDEPDGPRYDTIAAGVIRPVDAVLVDAGDNVLSRVPARKWRMLAARYAKGLREGRLSLIGLTREEVMP